MCMRVCVSVPVFHLRMCVCVCTCVCMCGLCVLIDRPEDHRGGSDPVCEEAVGRDDPDRLLS